jgi:hypothetical protein
MLLQWHVPLNVPGESALTINFPDSENSRVYSCFQILNLAPNWQTDFRPWEPPLYLRPEHFKHRSLSLHIALVYKLE